MLDKLKALSILVSPIQPLLVLVIMVCFSVFVTTLFDLSDMVKESYLIPSGIMGLWALAAWVMISSFQYVPELNSNLGVLKRIKAQFVRLFFYIITLGFIGLSSFILFVTLRMLSVWFRH